MTIRNNIKSCVVLIYHTLFGIGGIWSCDGPSVSSTLMGLGGWLSCGTISLLTMLSEILSVESTLADTGVTGGTTSLDD